MSIYDTFTAVPDQLLEMIGVTQDLMVTTAASLTKATQTLTPVMPAVPFADQMPDPTKVVGGAFDFAEKLLASQKNFSLKLIDAYAPAKPATKASTSSKA